MCQQSGEDQIARSDQGEEEGQQWPVKWIWNKINTNSITIVIITLHKLLGSSISIIERSVGYLASEIKLTRTNPDGPVLHVSRSIQYGFLASTYLAILFCFEPFLLVLKAFPFWFFTITLRAMTMNTKLICEKIEREVHNTQIFSKCLPACT